MSANDRLDQIHGRWVAWFNSDTTEAVWDEPLSEEIDIEDSVQQLAMSRYIVRQDVPTLVSALRAVLDLHAPVHSFRTDPRTFERVPVEDICGECSDDGDVMWPCSTGCAIAVALAGAS